MIHLSLIPCLSDVLLILLSTYMWNQQVHEDANTVHLYSISADCKHQGAQHPHFSLNLTTWTCFPYRARYLRWYKDLFFFKRKKRKNRSSAPGNQSLHDVVVRRDSEREELNMHITSSSSDSPSQCVSEPKGALFFLFFKAQFFALLCLCLSLRPAPMYL